MYENSSFCRAVINILESLLFFAFGYMYYFSFLEYELEEFTRAQVFYIGEEGYNSLPAFKNFYWNSGLVCLKQFLNALRNVVKYFSDPSGVNKYNRNSFSQKKKKTFGKKKKKRRPNQIDEIEK